MSAHLRTLRRCSDCDRAATKELYNRWNAPQGVFCDRHAERALREFQSKHEKAGSP